MKEPQDFCVHYYDGSCPCKICEDVVDDGTPILTPPCAFPYEVTIYPDAPPEPRYYEDYCLHYKQPKKS